MKDTASAAGDKAKEIQRIEGDWGHGDSMREERVGTRQVKIMVKKMEVERVTKEGGRKK